MGSAAQHHWCKCVDFRLGLMSRIRDVLSVRAELGEFGGLGCSRSDLRSQFDAVVCELQDERPGSKRVI